MTLAICWAVGNILDYQYRICRLLAAAAVGTLYLFAVLILHTSLLNNISLFISGLIHVIFNIMIAFLVIKISYPQLSKKNQIKGVGYLYLISFITIGSALSLFHIYNGYLTTVDSRNKVLAILFGLLAVIVLSNFGWRLFQKYISPDNLFLPVKVYFNEKQIELIGLVDTGNSLNDPISGVPVIVASLVDIITLFPYEMQDKIMDFENEIKAINLFTNFGLGDKVRVLPFSGVGQEHGLLIGFRPDKVTIIDDSKKIDTKKTIIGLSKNRLSKEDEYQLLIHPQLIKTDR